MKFIQILLIIFFFLSVCSAQNELEYKYLGALTISDSVLLTYELEFDIVGDSIFGYSYTDINGPDETKSKVLGNYDSDKGVFNFVESDILYTKSLYSEGDFCFVMGAGKLKVKKNYSEIEGSFVGKLLSGAHCANGSLKLISFEHVKQKVEKLTKRVKRSIVLKKETKERFISKNIIDDFKVSILKEGDNLTVFSKTNDIIVELWDNQIEDGDVVSVSFNNELILDHFKIKNKKKILKLHLLDQKNVLSFISNDTGLSGPTSGTINLIMDDKTINVTTSLELNKEASIVILNSK